MLGIRLKRERWNWFEGNTLAIESIPISLSVADQDGYPICAHVGSDNEQGLHEAIIRPSTRRLSNIDWLLKIPAPDRKSHMRDRLRAFAAIYTHQEATALFTTEKSTTSTPRPRPHSKAYI